MAVTNLKKQANKKNEGSLAYVKGGLSTFFEAQDALSGKCWKHGQSVKRELIIFSLFWFAKESRKEMYKDILLFYMI